MKPDPLVSKKAHGIMLLWSSIVGMSFVAVTQVNKELDPLLLTAFRFLMAAWVMLPMLFRRSDRFFPSKPAMRAYVALGACLAGFFATMFMAGTLISAVKMSILYLSVPLLCLLLGLLFGVEKWHWPKFIWLMIGTIGAVCMAMTRLDDSLGDFLSMGRGETLYMVGCLMMAFYPVLSRRYVSKGIILPSPLWSTFWSLLAGGILMAFIVTLTHPSAWLLFFEKACLNDYLWVAYLAIGSTCLTFWIMQKATLSLLPSQIMAYNFLLPVVALLVAWVQSPFNANGLMFMGALLVTIAMLSLMKQPAVHLTT